MQYIVFGDSTEHHRIGYRNKMDGRGRILRRRGRPIRVRHTRCGIRPGVRDRIVRKTSLPTNLCNTCLRLAKA